MGGYYIHKMLLEIGGELECQHEVGNAENMWQSRVEIKDYSVAY